MLLLQVRANVATMGGFCDDGTGTGVRAAAAGLGALRPDAEVSNLAVDGAFAEHARLRLGKRDRASSTAVERLANHLAGGGLLAFGTAGFGATSPSGPITHDAINGTRVHVATLVLHQVGAGLATVARLDGRHASAGLLAFKAAGV